LPSRFAVITLLSIYNHDRDIVQLTYVYPVVSRRAGGVSLGINLNPNNKCNWQCIYCQVPNLQRGVADAVDLALLEQELGSFLDELLHGNYMENHVPEQCRQLQDVAISGNGEPTTCPNFPHVVALIVRLMQKHKLDIPLRLISNGSCMHKTHIQQGLMLMAKQQGEVWFKVDVLGEAMTKAINGVSLSAAWQAKQLQQAAQVCSTWIQTCVMQQQLDDDMYMTNYVSWLNDVLGQGISVQGVLLYGLARPSMQDGGDTLVSADKHALAVFAQKIESLGLAVKVS